MIEFNIEELKQRLDLNVPFCVPYCNKYTWKELMDDGNLYSNQPLFDKPKEDDSVRCINHDSSPFAIYGCFGRFTYGFRRDNNNSDVIFTSRLNTDKTLICKNNNYCWMTNEELDYWISECKKITGLNFFYEIKRDEDEKAIYVTFDFKRNIKFVAYKFVIFWLRYAFESPASLSALDAMMLQKYYPEESLLNLLTLTVNCQSVNRARMSSTQCLTSSGSFVSTEYLRNYLNSLNTDIFDLFYKYPAIKYGVINNRTIPPFFKVTDPNQRYYSPVHDWLEIGERFDIYRSFYDDLKRLEKKGNKTKTI